MSSAIGSNFKETPRVKFLELTRVNARWIICRLANGFPPEPIVRIHKRGKSLDSPSYILLLFY